MRKVLIRNMASNWAGYFVSAAIAFFMSPFLLHSLGNVRFGAWVLATSLTGYYGALGLGLRQSLAQYITRSYVSRDFDQLNRVAGTAGTSLRLIGGLVALASLLLAQWAPIIFHLEPELVSEFRRCVVVFGIATGVQFALSPFATVYIATQRFDVSNVIGISGNLIKALVTVAVVKAGYGLTGVAVVMASGSVLGDVTRWRIARLLIPQMHVSARNFDRNTLLMLFNYGGWAYLINLARGLIPTVRLSVVGAMMPSAALAPIGIAISACKLVEQIFTPLGPVFFPAAVHLEVSGRTDKLREVYLVGSRALLMSAGAIGLISVSYAPEFFRLWVGAKAAQGGSFAPIYLLYAILIPGTIAESGQRLGLQVIFAQKKLGRQAVAFGGELVVMAVLMAALIPAYGLIGAAVGASLGQLLFKGILQPLIVGYLLTISLREYVSAVLSRLALTLVVSGIALYFMKQWFHAANSWTLLIAYGAVASVFTSAVIAAVGFSSQEKKRYLYPSVREGYLLLSSLWGKLRRKHVANQDIT